MSAIAFFYPDGHEAHFESGHPERPQRLEAIRSAFQNQEWWEDAAHLQAMPVPQDVLRAVHSPDYLEVLQAASRQGRHLDADTYTTPASWDLALQAAGGAIAIARSVWLGENRSGFALTRPPGHHATRNRGMGFCLLNNIAIATEDLLQRGEARKLAIVDLDLHHGNGTQDIFYQRGEVLYISTHQSPLYPGTGFLTETGAADGQGANANFPLPPYTGNRGFKVVMQDFILPLLDRFSPEMLLVSVGFDPHWRDPLGMLMLSAKAYGDLVSDLASWANEHAEGKIALFLEGGYDLEAGAACALASVSALLQLPFDDPLGPSPYEESDAWRRTIEKAQALWNV